MIDLGGEIAAALRNPQVVNALMGALRPVIADVVRLELERRDGERLVDLRGLADLLACTTAAAKQRVRRDPELAGLALRVGSRRRWRRSEVLHLIEARRLERRE